MTQRHRAWQGWATRLLKLSAYRQWEDGSAIYAQALTRSPAPVSRAAFGPRLNAAFIQGIALDTQHPELFALGTQVLQAQPFSGFIGAELATLAPGRATLSLAVGPHHQQQYGQVHGGVLAYLADNAMAFAAGSLTGTPVVTAEFKIQYIAPALGTRLHATAQVESAGKRLLACSCRIECEDAMGGRTEVAIGLGTISITGNASS